MFKLVGTDIYLTRGDTLFLTVELMDKDGETYVPEQGDSLRFALKKKFKSEDVLVLKPIPISTMLLEIEPEDTKPLAFGTYVYDIEFTDAMGHVDTVIVANFNVTEEVY